VDDVIFIWIGQKAYTGWTRANADVGAYYAIPGQVSINLQQAIYYPMRIVFGQSSGGSAFQLIISDPNGVVAFTYSSASPYFVRYSCDGTSAPRYNQLFGAET
jgi:hypothetical protein